jgi:hypothetical protein
MPQRIGPYRLVRMIGEAGMGTVFLGERDDETYKKRVALTVMRHGEATGLLERRLKAERDLTSRAGSTKDAAQSAAALVPRRTLTAGITRTTCSSGSPRAPLP